MTEENGLAVANNNSGLMPAMTIEAAVGRYNAVVEFTKQVMKPQKDYGPIPGAGDKPTLLKPGAEKLCTLFGLVPDFETIKEIVDFEKGLFYFREKCTLYRNGESAGSGIGSCNSMEKKYRYRYVYENKATEDDKRNAVSVETKNGKYGPYKVYKIENKEPFDLLNTIDKMAQKRALVAATLIATNASEFFTQDIEDMDFIDAEYHDVEPAIAEHAQPKSQPKHEFGERPWDAETLKAALQERATGKNAGCNPSDKQRNLLGMLLSEFFQDDDKRHAAQLWLLGAASTKDVDGGMVKTAIDWLAPEKAADGSGSYVINSVSKTELSGVYDAAVKSEGQETLI